MPIVPVLGNLRDRGGWISEFEIGLRVPGKPKLHKETLCEKNV